MHASFAFQSRLVTLSSQIAYDKYNLLDVALSVIYKSLKQSYILIVRNLSIDCDTRNSVPIGISCSTGIFHGEAHFYAIGFSGFCQIVIVIAIRIRNVSELKRTVLHKVKV